MFFCISELLLFHTFNQVDIFCRMLLNERKQWVCAPWRFNLYSWECNWQPDCFAKFCVCYAGTDAFGGACVKILASSYCKAKKLNFENMQWY